MVVRAGLANPGEVPEDPMAGINPNTGVNPAANSGLSSLSNDYATAATMGEQPMVGLNVSRSAMQMPQDPFADIEQELARGQREIDQMLRPQTGTGQGPRLLYSPSRRQFLFNNVVVDEDDAEYLSRAGEFLQEPIETDLPEGDWVTTDPTAVQIAAERAIDLGFTGRFGFGVKSTAENIVGGAGRIATMMGAENVGGALEQAGEFLGPTDIEEGQLAVANASSELWQKMLGAIPESIPTMLASIGGSVLGGLAIRGPYGAAVGAFTTILPMMVKSAYESAVTQMGEEYANSPQGKKEIAITSLANSILQSYVPSVAGSAILKSLAREAAENVVRRPGRLATAATLGATEAFAEASGYLLDQAVFDPVVRESLSKSEVAAIWPHLIDRHGEALVINAFAGAVLGGGAGLLVGGGREASKIKENTETDLNEVVNQELRKDDVIESIPQRSNIAVIPSETTAEEDLISIRGQGPQGVLPMEGLGGRIERARRSRQVGYGALPQVEPELLEGPPSAIDTRQLDLDFASVEAEPEVESTTLPEPTRDTALGQELTRQFRQQEFEQATAQRRDRETVAAEAQRQQQIAEAERDTTRPVDLLQPTRGVGEAVPQQQDLFTRRQAPVMSRGEQLRRGIQQPPATVPDIDQVDAIQQTETQQELFTRRGEPTVAARAAPITPAEPGGVYGTTTGAPFTNKVTANRLSTKERVSRDTGIPVDQLEVIERDGGFYLARIGDELVAQGRTDTDREGTDTGQGTTNQQGTTTTIDEASSKTNVDNRRYQVAAEDELLGIMSKKFGAEDGIPANIAEQWNSLTNIPWQVLLKEQKQNWKTLVETDPDNADIFDVLTEDGKEVFGLIYDVVNPDAGIVASIMDAAFATQINNDAKALAIRYLEQKFAENDGNGISAPIMIQAFTDYISVVTAQKVRNLHDYKGGHYLFNYMLNHESFTDPLESTHGKDWYLTNDQKKEIARAQKRQKNPDNEGNSQGKTNPVDLLYRAIKGYKAKQSLDSRTAKAARKKLTELYQKIVTSNTPLNTVVDGVDLLDYFEDGVPKLQTGSNIPVLEIFTEEDIASARADARRDREDLAGEEVIPAGSMVSQALKTNADKFDLRDKVVKTDDGEVTFPDGRLLRSDGTSITKPLPRGQIRLNIRSFVKKLKAKPNISTYRDVADFKNRNPKLYEQALKSRPDLETLVDPMALSYGEGNIAIFTDRILTTDQLRLVLAHETLGHYGFKAMLGPQRLQQIMLDLYSRYDIIRTHVDNAIIATQNKDTSEIPAAKLKELRAEFTEEYMADVATVIDTRILTRLWYAIKNAIESFTNIRFDDHMARYLISQSRKYVRNGKVDVQLLSVSQLGQDIVNAEQGIGYENLGRFARGVADMAAISSQIGTLGDVIGVPSSIKEAGETLRKFKINTRGTLDGAVEQLFSLRTFRFRENAGAEAVFDTVTMGRNTALRILNKTNSLMANALNIKIAKGVKPGRFGYVTKEEYDATNKLLYEALFYNLNNFRASMLGDESLVYLNEKTNAPEINPKEFARLSDIGRLKLEQIRNGLTYKKVIKNEDGTETEIGEGKVTAIPDINADHPVWKAYEAARNGIEYIWQEKLLADYEALLVEKDLSYRRIANYMDGDRVTKGDRQLLEAVNARAFELYNANKTVDEIDGAVFYDPESMKKSDEVMELLNRSLLGVETADGRNAIDALLENFDDAQQQSMVRNNVEDMRRRLNFSKDEARKKNERFIVQDSLKKIVGNQTQVEQSERLAKQTLAQGYTPLKRDGKFQMRLVARNEAGEVVRLDENHQNLLAFRMFRTDGEARTMAKKVNETLLRENGVPKVFEGVRAYNSETQSYEPTKVTIEAVSESALTEQSAPLHLNINEFMAGLRRFNIVLQPDKVNEVVLALTKQNNAARTKLLREGTPGYDPDAIRAISQFAESMGSAIGKTRMRPYISEYMDLSMRSTQELWNGSPRVLKQLKDTYETLRDTQPGNINAVAAARMEYNKYAMQFRKTNPEEGVSRANTYRNEASSLLSFLDGNATFQESVFESQAVVAKLRAYTSIFQLGASISTASLNYLSAWMNGIPMLATYNEKTAFGGGFGFGRSTMEFVRAGYQVGIVAGTKNLDLNNADIYESMLGRSKEAKALRDKYGLEEHEAEFIAKEIRQGVLIPAQSNALTGTARGVAKSVQERTAIDAIMLPFNLSEQGSRRSLALAAYRMELERQMARLPDNPNEFQVNEARQLATEFAVKTLDQSIGRYDVSNRPPVFRGGILSLLYMYKVFPTTTIQMLRNLDRKGQLTFLFGLFMLSGIKGFPFAEDMEDMIDTIGQGLGWKWRGTKVELGEWLEDVAPGFSPIFFRGVTNQLLGFDLGARVELGNFIPGTAILLSGSNKMDESISILGPIASMGLALAQTIPDAMRATAGLVTGNERVTFEDVARNSPIVMLKAFGDAFAYHQSGAIVDKRGYVISPDASVYTMLTRLMGWYPADAANQYDIIRSSQRMANYQREVSASFRIAWIKARIRNDVDGMRSVERSVRDWNRGARGTSLVIKDFRKNAVRAYKEARRPAVDRYIRTTPEAARQDMRMVNDILGL